MKPWFVFLMLITSCWIHAAPEAQAVPAPDIITGASVLRLLLGLGFVIFLIVALAWLAKRYGNLTASNQDMKVIASLPLGAREKAVLIAVGDKQVLLGVAPGRVNLIESFDGEVVADNASAPVSGMPFAQALVEAVQRGGKQ